ncbi:hypothetical protein GCM10022200_02100 [Microbacterium awajiense]|uniref:Cell division protein FtsL n=1 Tax=Microbacterium awajiense TaxID=415214 RepID=A0ABP7A268_9MICO
MSTAATARTDSARLTSPAPSTPRRAPWLRPVADPGRRRRPRVVYAIVALLGALTIAGAQMALSILTTQGSYEIAALTQQQQELTWQKQILADDIAGLSSPQYLAANASALGMLIAESPSYLRLSDGAVLGTGQAAVGRSSIDALGRGAVGNALITDRPLVTDPKATILGQPTVAAEESVITDTPPPITDGLPTPNTH